MEPALQLWIGFLPALRASPGNCSTPESCVEASPRNWPIPESRVENCGRIRTQTRTEKQNDVMLADFRVYLMKLDAVVPIFRFFPSRC